MRKRIFVVLAAVVGSVIITAMVYAMPPSFVRNVLGSVAGMIDSEPPDIKSLVRKDQATSTIEVPQTTGATDSDTGNVPDRVTFDMLFGLVIQLQAEADRLESEGKSGKIWRDYLLVRSGLTSEEVSALKDTALQFVDELGPVHSRVLQIVETNRAKHSNGRVQAEEKISPNRELASLQQKREKIVLKYRELLESRLGSESFQRLRQFSLQKFSPDKTQILDEAKLKLLKERATSGADQRGLTLLNEPQGGAK